MADLDAIARQRRSAASGTVAADDSRQAAQAIAAGSTASRAQTSAPIVPMSRGRAAGHRNGHRTAKGLPEGFAKDRKDRAYRDLGRFNGTQKLLVYVEPPERGKRRDESARVVLAGYFPELKVNVRPWQAMQLDRRAALLLLWDRLIERIDAREAAAGAAADFEALLVAEGITVPGGPLHRPGLPRLARAILAYRQAHPAASQRMIARAVQCDPGRVCQVFRKYGDPADRSGERSAESPLNIQRGFSADSAHGHAAENGVSPERNIENGAAGDADDLAPPLCTSSFFKKEDDGAPPPAAADPRPALVGPSRPVVAGNAAGDSARPMVPREMAERHPRGAPA